MRRAPPDTVCGARDARNRLPFQADTMSHIAPAPALPDPRMRTSLPLLLSWAAMIVLLGWSWHGADMRPMDLLRDSDNITRLAADFFPPDFRDWRMYIEEMLVTIQIAIWGTFLAIVCAVPFGLLCSSNIVPPWVYQPVRRLMDACRAINEVVFAMLFIAAVGLGPFAGVLALWIHTTGILAKLFSEAVEAIDPRPVEGVRATGANALEEIVYGVLPQVMPMWVSLSLYRFESNVRSASVLGIVGAGGIGMVIWEILRSFQYAQTCAVMIIIMIAVFAIDTLSARLRRALI